MAAESKLSEVMALERCPPVLCPADITDATVAAHVLLPKHHALACQCQLLPGPALREVVISLVKQLADGQRTVGGPDLQSLFYAQQRELLRNQAITSCGMKPDATDLRPPAELLSAQLGVQRELDLVVELDIIAFEVLGPEVIRMLPVLDRCRLLIRPEPITLAYDSH